MLDWRKIDLHLHTTVSDGTDQPEELLRLVKEAGIELFSVTDHDALKGCLAVGKVLKEGDPAFITGVEFSCRDELGKYHILGYGYDPEGEAIRRVVDLGHSYRMRKLRRRLEFLREEFHFDFPKEELEKIYALDNPGKPHIGNLMTKLGYVSSKEEAIRDYINKAHFPSQYVRPEEAIRGILNSGGIPVLAHPIYGSGDQLILGEEMDERLQRLTKSGLKGVEAFYSGFTDRLQKQMLRFAERYNLYVTAGSDYHGTNKLVILGDTGLDTAEEMPEGMERFLKDVTVLNGKAL